MLKKVFLLEPSEFFLFQLAEKQHKTVQELLTGKVLPLSHAELIQWYAYYRVKQSKEQQAQRHAEAKGRRGRRR